MKTKFPMDSSRENRPKTQALFILSIIALTLTPSSSTKTDTCEYDIDLSGKRVKITCQGSSSMINVFASRALLQADEYDKLNNFRENTYDKYETNANKPNFGQSFPGTYPRKVNTDRRKPFDPEQQKQTSEKLRFPEAGQQCTMVCVDAQNDKEVPSHYNWFAELVLDISERLQATIQDLLSCSESIKNISDLLRPVDVNLGPDMENLRKWNNSLTGMDLIERIITALTNQFKFMSGVLKSKSKELRNLAEAMIMLLDVTSDGLNSTLTAHKMVTAELSLLDAFLVKLRKRASREISKEGASHKQDVRKSKAENCPKQISAIGLGTMTKVQWPAGSYMVESANPGDRRSVFIMADTGPTSQLREYQTALEVEYDLVGKYLTLPVACSGTGHTVYRRHFYCHKAGSNLIVKYHLKRMEIVSELALPGAKFGNSRPYKSGANTDIDLAVDELGLWAVYATDLSDGNMVITKIDTRKMEIGNTWTTNYPKLLVGNAFMICGVLYATNSHSDTPTFIRYVFNTETNQEQLLEEGAVSFANSALLGVIDRTQTPIEEKSANSVMLSYDFRNSVLYSWSNGRVESFPVYFKV